VLLTSSGNDERRLSTVGKQRQQPERATLSLRNLHISFTESKERTGIKAEVLKLGKPWTAKETYHEVSSVGALSGAARRWFGPGRLGAGGRRGGPQTAGLHQGGRGRVRHDQEHGLGHHEQPDDPLGRRLQEAVPQRHHRDR